MANIFKKPEPSRPVAKPTPWPPGPDGRDTPFSVLGFTYNSYGKAGFEFRRDGIRNFLRRWSIHCSKDDPPHIIIAKNKALVFRTLQFYLPFRAHPRLHEMIAEDIRWPPQFVSSTIRTVCDARKLFLKEKENANKHLLSKAHRIERILWKLVDNYNSLPRLHPVSLIPPAEEIFARRDEWKEMVATNPDILMRRRNEIARAVAEKPGRLDNRTSRSCSPQAARRRNRRSRSPLRERTPRPKPEMKKRPKDGTDRKDSPLREIKVEPQDDDDKAPKSPTAGQRDHTRKKMDFLSDSEEEMFVRQPDEPLPPRKLFRMEARRMAHHEEGLMAAGNAALDQLTIPPHERILLVSSLEERMAEYIARLKKRLEDSI